MLIQTQSVNNTNANTAAYCKARKRLSLLLLTQLVKKIGELIHNAAPYQWQWFGLSVSLINNKLLTMRDTQSDQTKFLNKAHKRQGWFFPFAGCLLSVVCILT
jgi:hypothetical protein